MPVCELLSLMTEHPQLSRQRAMCSCSLVFVSRWLLANYRIPTDRTTVLSQSTSCAASNHPVESVLSPRCASQRHKKKPSGALSTGAGTPHPFCGLLWPKWGRCWLLFLAVVHERSRCAFYDCYSRLYNGPSNKLFQRMRSSQCTLPIASRYFMQCTTTHPIPQFGTDICDVLCLSDWEPVGLWTCCEGSFEDERRKCCKAR